MPTDVAVRRGTTSKTLTKEQVAALLLDRGVTQGLDPHHVAAFVDAARVVTFPEPGAVVIEEGETADEVFVVLEGEVRVERQGSLESAAHTLTTLGAGQSFGEAALRAGQGVRSATVVTNEKTRLLCVDARVLQDPSAQAWALPILLRLGGESAKRLADASLATIEALEARQAESARRISLAHFLGWVVGVLCLYTLSLSLMLTVVENTVLASMCSNAAILASGYGMYRFLKATPFPRQAFGLVWPKDWLAQALEGVVWAIGLSALVTAVKWLVVGPDTPLFEPRWQTPGTTMTAVAVVGVVYLLLAFVQEFIVRGTLQSALILFMDEHRYRTAYAIGMSNLIFSAYHAHLSAKFAAGAFVLGLFWGLQYARQGSVWGVGVSHALVGTYAIQFLGVTAFR